jgi:TusA-related sulfurtransferase
MMNTGETLEVSATDPAFCEDVRAWCEMTGNQLLAMEQRDAGCRAIIRKSQAKEE